MKFKFKNTLLVSFLAIAGILGVSSALIYKQVNEQPVVEKADAAAATTLYCEMKQSWWTTDGASVGIHYWGGSSSTSWPGVKMNWTGVDGVWSYTVPSGTTKVIFTRLNGDGDTDWGAKTKNQTIPTDGTNYCTIITSSAVWGDPGCDTLWSVKKDTSPAAATNQFYVHDPHGVLSGTMYVYGYDNNQKNLLPEWPGTSSNVTGATLGITTMKTVSLSTSYPTFIMNNGTNETVPVTISGNTGKVLVIETGKDGSGHYYTHWSPASDFNTDYPASTGYYVYGSKTSWTFTGATKMTDETGENIAKLISYSGKKDEKIKVRGYFTDREYPYIDSYYVGGKQSFGQGDGDANFVFNYDIVVDIYAKYELGQLNVYVNEHFETDGYFMLGDEDFVSETGGSGHEWTFATGLHMTSLSGEGNKASAVLSVTTSAEFRVRKHISGSLTWLDFPTAYDGTDGITRNSDGNVELTSGTYTIYVNSSEAVYVMRGIPLDAFCTDFLEVIGNVCKLDGSTDQAALISKWSELSSVYDSVISEGKEAIEDIGFNGGSDADDAHKVVLVYHYIVTKYGTSKCEDFIWGQTISGRSAIRDFSPLNLFGDEDNLSTIIIIAASSVALLSVTALSILVIRKRKTRED